MYDSEVDGDEVSVEFEVIERGLPTDKRMGIGNLTTKLDKKKTSNVQDSWITVMKKKKEKDVMFGEIHVLYTLREALEEASLASKLKSSGFGLLFSRFYSVCLCFNSQLFREEA